MSNINMSSSESHDPFFRYKMPRVLLKHEGNGNGVKTVLKNLRDISKSLNRDPYDMLQYIAAELSVCSLQKKEDMIVNGIFSVDTIQDIIKRFMISHVLCDICDNPETILSAQRNGRREDHIISKTCLACGCKSVIKPHKINKRIKC